jgi:hypothetical protein
MEIITSVFELRTKAEEAIRRLQEIGIPKKRMSLLTPGTDPAAIEERVPITDTEGVGLGKAMGGAVGGGLGAAGGATLGLAAASLVVPGVGPVIAFGVLGAALLGVGGAVAGAAVGETIEEELGEGLPHEDLYVYEDTLRHGKSLVIAYVENEDQAEKAHEILEGAGAEDLDELRENWWQELRDEEKAHYQHDSRDFERDELSYRRGFQAALHAERRGKSYAQVEQGLRSTYGDSALDTAFRHGYERGRAYHVSIVEIPRG